MLRDTVLYTSDDSPERDRPGRHGGPHDLRALLLGRHPGTRRIRAARAGGSRRALPRHGGGPGGAGRRRARHLESARDLRRPAPALCAPDSQGRPAAHRADAEHPAVLGGPLKLAPRDEPGRLWTHQLALTILDFYVEIFDTHHPLGDGYAYEEQKAEAKRRTRYFLAVRLPKFLGYFERVLELNGSRRPWMVGARLSYADLSMAQVIAGLKYAFPSASARTLRRRPRLRALHQAVFDRPRIARYAASGRRLDFNNEDLFRHYPELDR